MTIYNTLDEIERSLTKKIEQFCGKERLKVAVQIESHDDIHDVVALLFDSEDLVLLDEVYKCDIENENAAMKDGSSLLRKITEWTKDANVELIEEIGYASH